MGSGVTSAAPKIPTIMTGLGDIIILIVVFRLIFGILGALFAEGQK